MDAGPLRHRSGSGGAHRCRLLQRSASADQQPKSCGTREHMCEMIGCVGEWNTLGLAACMCIVYISALRQKTQSPRAWLACAGRQALVTCTDCMHRLYAQITCTDWMYRLDTHIRCTDYMHRLHAQITVGVSSPDIIRSTESKTH